MNFRRYSSIENSYRTKEINTILEQGKNDGVWRLSEKIHGSNFSFWYDGKKLKCAKRSAFLKDDSDFFNWEFVYDNEKAKILKMWEFLQENPKFVGEEKIEEMILFGELFGGVYPHPEVEREYNAITVQKGIYYTPKNMFYCFDIKTNGKFINEHIKEELCKKFDILYDEPLFEGTFAECLEYKNEYQTTIPKKFGLPEIKDNICEGNVIKPIEPKYYWNGSRVILKNKNDKWSEKTKGNKNKGEKRKQEALKLSETGQKLLDEASTYVTENRLRNVLSKMEKITDKDFGKVMSNCQKDTMEDFLKDNRDEFVALDKKEQKAITKKTGSEWALLLRSNFLNIIDGIF